MEQQTALRVLILDELDNMNECMGGREPTPREAVWRNFFRQVYELLFEEEMGLASLKRLIELFKGMASDKGEGVFCVEEFEYRRTTIEHALEALVIKIDPGHTLKFDLRDLCVTAEQSSSAAKRERVDDEDEDEDEDEEPSVVLRLTCVQFDEDSETSDKTATTRYARMPASWVETSEPGRLVESDIAWTRRGNDVRVSYAPSETGDEDAGTLPKDLRRLVFSPDDGSDFALWDGEKAEDGNYCNGRHNHIVQISFDEFLAAIRAGITPMFYDVFVNNL